MPIFLIVILAILFLFVLLFTLRVRLVITCGEAVILKLRVLCFTITLFPKPKKQPNPNDYTEKKIKRRARRAEKKAARRARRSGRKAKKNALDAAKKAHEPQRKPTLRDNLTLARALVAALVRKTSKHLRLTAARLHIRVATGDAATTAVLYGAVSASLAYLLAALDRVTDLRTKPHDVSVYADYLTERSHVDVKLVFSLRVWGALSLLTAAAFTFLKTRRAQKAAKHKTAGPKKNAIRNCK